jgi:hypothetical protein
MVNRNQNESNPNRGGPFTGQRLKLLRPETYRQAVELLAEPREQVPYDRRNVARWAFCCARR